MVYPPFARHAIVNSWNFMLSLKMIQIVFFKNDYCVIELPIALTNPTTVISFLLPKTVLYLFLSTFSYNIWGKRIKGNSAFVHVVYLCCTSYFCQVFLKEVVIDTQHSRVSTVHAYMSGCISTSSDRPKFHCMNLLIYQENSLGPGFVS